uniref:Uncharacterized protein n=1 Tax=Cyanistes caeruleus TaxID=156563 RepID=A0A8C0ZA34_CYACU
MGDPKIREFGVDSPKNQGIPAREPTGSGRCLPSVQSRFPGRRRSRFPPGASCRRTCPGPAASPGNSARNAASEKPGSRPAHPPWIRIHPDPSIPVWIPSIPVWIPSIPVWIPSIPV